MAAAALIDTMKLRPWLLVVGGGLLALASTWGLPLLTVNGAWPDLMTVYALVFALYGSNRGSYLPCMVLGLIRDVLTVGPFGTFAVLYGVMCKLVRPVRGLTNQDHPLTQLVIGCVAVCAVQLGYHASMVATGIGVGWESALWHAGTIALMSGPLLYPASLGLRFAMARLEATRGSAGQFEI